jgi:hypothetical protein
VNLRFQYTSPFRPVFGHCMPNYYSHYHQNLFNLFIPSFPRVFSFPYFSRSGSHYLLWHSFIIYPFNFSIEPLI